MEESKKKALDLVEKAKKAIDHGVQMQSI